MKDVSVRRRTRPLSPISSATPPEEASSSFHLAGYELEGEMRRGGQGVVYRALQLRTGRPVAIKIQRGCPSSSDLARRRFEREIDLVAGLDHPNIVTLFDSGFANGAPYFVMQLVEGRDLDEHLGNTTLTTAEALRLFLALCDAVAHAHARGVIHRDLKPENVRIDEDGQPHVLDFGIAKSTVEGSGLTATGAVVGSLSSLAPEQLSGSSEVVDVRTDVHALGLLLYRLLTDAHPYRVDEDVATAVRSIVEDEPVRPARARPGLPPDLDAIVLKAIAKNPDRRYQSVDSLSRDVRNHLAGRVVEARAHVRTHVLARTISRYRLPIGAASALIAALSIAILVVARSRDDALMAKTEAQLAVVQAEAARQQAEREAAASSQLVAVYARLIGEAAPEISASRGGLVPDLLRREAAALLESPTEDLGPRRRSVLLHSLGETLLKYGEHQAADPLLEESLSLQREHLPKPDLRFVRTLRLVAEIREIRGEIDASHALHLEALELQATMPEVSDAEVVSSMANHADHLVRANRLEAAERLIERGLARAERLPPDQEEVRSHCLNSLAHARLKQGRVTESDALLSEVLRIRIEQAGNAVHPAIARTHDRIRTTSVMLGDVERARRHSVRARDVLALTHPADGIPLARASLLAADAALLAGDAADARRLLGPAPSNDRLGAGLMARLAAIEAEIALAEGRLASAEERARHGLALPNHPTRSVTARLLATLGEARARQGDGDQGERTKSEARALIAKSEIPWLELELTRRVGCAAPVTVD